MISVRSISRLTTPLSVIANVPKQLSRLPVPGGQKVRAFCKVLALQAALGSEAKPRYVDNSVEGQSPARYLAARLKFCDLFPSRQDDLAGDLRFCCVGRNIASGAF
jgi:hypothetical protein